MARAWWVLLASTGCSAVFGVGDPTPAPPDAPPPPTPSCVVAGFDLCAHQEPNGPITFEADSRIDTTLDCNVVLFEPTGGSVCVIYATDLVVNASVHATGARPLALAATGTITVNGTVDVSSSSTDGSGAAADVSCPLPANLGSLIGGAGGSFQGKGGNGGAGLNAGVATASDPALEVVALPTTLHGGCRGHGFDSLGGSSGGAVELVASSSIAIGGTGRILAGGAGGRPYFFTGTSGGGGGSGGMVILRAPAIAVHGVVAANGGGGAGGSGSAANMTTTAGGDGLPSAMIAIGSPGPGGGGAGGNGAAGSVLVGTAGASSTGMNSGGGGGGGGAGFIVLAGTTVDTSSSTISPSPMVNE